LNRLLLQNKIHRLNVPFEKAANLEKELKEKRGDQEETPAVIKGRNPADISTSREGVPGPRWTSAGNLASFRALHQNTRVQPKIRKGPASDPYEQEADVMAEQALQGKAAGARPAAVQPRIQRQAADVNTEPASAPEAAPATAPSLTETQTDAKPTGPSNGLLVEDGSKELTAGQMTKSEFLGRLHTAVSAAAESALAGTIWSVAGCPWIDHWFGYYSGRDAQSIERAIQRYTGSAGVASAADYIPVICTRVRSAIESWRTSGETKGAPEEVPADLPDTAPSSGEGGPSAKGPLSFKTYEGKPAKSADPATVQARLDSGSPLDSGIRSQMETAFGQDFTGVRVHTDAGAGNLSQELGARAFTVGKDIAFSPGEYMPGTLIGDALLAHELAHVVQQKGSDIKASTQSGETDTSVYEDEADTAAAGAVTSIRGGMKNGIASIAHNAIPRIKSGLRLQRCRKKEKPSPTPEIPLTEEAVGKRVVDTMEAVNAGATGPDRGIHYAHNYKSDYPGRWNEDYWHGYANPAYFERIGHMDWRLKPGVSASAGIKAWIGGLTIAECLSAVVAIQTDTVRASIGDEKFDNLFGSADKDVPESQRLRVRAGWKNASIEKLVVPANSGEGTIGHRPAKVGERYYFYNHPKYLLKHLGGAWQGENSIYAGEENGVQIWEGLGASHMTEDAMLDKMVEKYNIARTARDLEVLNGTFGDEAHWPAIYKEGSGNFPDQINKQQLLSEPEYTITIPASAAGTRKGGFVASLGRKIDLDAVKKL
jgi:hypothetical protein